MTSITKFESLSGSCDESPPCYLLQVDEFKFLLDCGWDEMSSSGYFSQLEHHAKHIDAVLLSHPDLLHIGALPYLVGKCGLSCPIYATVPVYKMGQMFMYDLHQSKYNYEDFVLFSLDDVDCAFERITSLKYNQSVVLKGKGQGLTITPMPAGHMIGGTIWKIWIKEGEEEIIYAVDYNHKKERHLNNCVLEQVSRPSLLITDSYNALYTQARRRYRDEQLMTTILATLRGGGNVLIAVDTAGRVLELTHMLDQLWRNQDSGLMAYSLALLNTFSYNVIEFAKSQVEWMSDKIMRSFEGQRNNPFQFKHLQLCHNLTELNRVREPRVILASQPDLESGFSKELFIQSATNPRNSIVLTQRCAPGTLVHQLINSPNKRLITMEIKQRIPLDGLELEEYRRNEMSKAITMIKVDKPESDSESDEHGNDSDVDDMETAEETTMAEVALNLNASQAKHDLMMKHEGKQRSGGFFKQAKKSYPMFPAYEKKMKWDDYGEIINPADFIVFDHSSALANHQEMASDEKKERTAGRDFDGDGNLTADRNVVPNKCVVNVQTINCSANVQYIDFEGRSDGESIKKILSMIKPRRLILVRGTEEATESLANHCKVSGAVANVNMIFKPKLGEVIDATTESHIYQVKLKDSLVTNLNLVTTKDGAELAWVDAEIEMPEEESLFPKKEGEVADSKQDNDANSLALTGRERVPTLQAFGGTSSHGTIFINELKLSDFKQVLMKNGILAEFSGGILYCNSMVAIRRNEAGRVHLEGTLSDDYFKIRELLYKQYAVI